MKRVICLSVAVMLLVVFIGGCSVRSDDPGISTETQSETIKPETTTETTTVETTTEKSDETTLPEPLTFEDKKLEREPLIYDEIDPDKPMVAITFDDGPSAHTPRLLNILKKYDVKATFFVVGSQIKGNEALLQRMADEGHEIASHSWSHPHLTSLDIDDMSKQLNKTRSAIKEATGKDVFLVRPPYGSCDDTVKYVAAEQGVSLIMWSVDPRDWQYRNASSVYSRTMSSVRNGDIILYHDLHGTTVDAMENVIPALINKGYQLVTVSELLTYEKDELNAGYVYRRR